MTQSLGGEVMEHMDSILSSIKLRLPIPVEVEDFDQTIIMHINAVFAILTEDFGLGPKEGFYIRDASATWDDYMEDCPKRNKIDTYMYAKVKLLFDPPQSSAHLEALKSITSEFEWRSNLDTDSWDD